MADENPDHDPRFHFEIWKGPSEKFEERTALYYVENHNGQVWYSEAALDFRMAADVIIENAKITALGNWTAPLAHLVRHFLELRLKALYCSLREHDSALREKPLSKHDIWLLWTTCKDWLIHNGYPFLDDARISDTELLISAFHSVDPAGDLFRFAMSRKKAFGKFKSSDRAGLEITTLERQLEAADRCIGHWDAVLFRKIMAREEGWEVDPYFDADDFPRS